MTKRWWMAGLLAAGLAVAGCGGDDGGAATEAPATVPPATDAPATDVPATDVPATVAPADDGAATTGDAAGILVFGDEEVAIDDLLCFFEEQPRAGLGGVFTHTAQGRGTMADGEPIVLDLSRARDEDGTVEDDITVDIGDPFSDDAVSLRGSGPEGTIEFGDASAAAEGVEVSDFASDPVTVSFDLSC